MGQLLGPEKIGALTQTGGVISLAPSNLLIGGQGFKTGILTLSVGSPTANTLYYIYAVRSAGNTILVSSTNANSVGPATYSSWKLVGAYYSNGLASPAFGSFVNIEGALETNYIPFVVSSTLTTNVTHTGYWKRSGSSMKWKINSAFSGAGNGSQEAIYTIPMSLNIDSSFPDGTVVGKGDINASGVVHNGALAYRTASTSVSLYYLASNLYKVFKPNGSGNLDTVNGSNAEFTIIVPISEWANITDLKSL